MVGHISYPRAAAIADAWSNYRHAVRLADIGALEAAIYKLEAILDDLNATEPLRGRVAVLLGNLYFRLHPGLAIRADLARHLRGPDGWNGKHLHGTHNLDLAINAIRSRYPNATINIRQTTTPGIEELDYRSGHEVRGRKTVYNPAIFSDDQILALGQKAAAQAWKRYKLDPREIKHIVTINAVNFMIYINIDPQTGTPFVGNLFPVP